MLPIREKLQRDVETSFRFGRRNGTGFTFQWHQHPECELTLIETGTGQRFVGDNIDEYEPGDMVLLGPDLPHTWASHDNSAKRHKAIVIQFSADWLQAMLSQTPEANAILSLIEKSKRGLRFTGRTQRYAAEALLKMTKQKGMPRVLSLISLLEKLARSRGTKSLASPAYDPSGHTADSRTDRVCRFINDHVTEPITQSQAADLIGMSGPAFSRFFRQRVGMTYSRYVHELRIGHACRLLIESDRSITDICFASGFNNLSNFNRVFLSIKGVSPRAYRRQHSHHTG